MLAEIPKSHPVDDNNFPIKTAFSLKPLINAFWDKFNSQASYISKGIGEKVKEELAKAPELLGHIDDPSILEKHKALVDVLMGVVFPAATLQYENYCALEPFHLKSFYESPGIKKFGLFDENIKILDGKFWAVDGKLQEGRLMYAFLGILNKFYKVSLHYEFPFIFSYKDSVTGLERHARLRILPYFLDIIALKEPRKISEEEIKDLMDDVLNTSKWMKLIPPENFMYEGFMIFHLVDVTFQEIVSSLKYELIDNNSIISLDKFNKLEKKVQAIFKMPQLAIGLTALPGDDRRLANGQPLGKSLLISDSCSCDICNFQNSIYEKILSKTETIVIRDLTEYKDCTQAENEALKKGIRNLAIAPLKYNDEVIGFLELGSPNPGDLHEMNCLMLKDILPLFALCVKRSMEDLNNRVESVIKEKCTAIHPAVEWKFRVAALDFIQREKDDVYAEMNEIIFENVYPLFGESDIRDSSKHRNASIQEDLKENLKMSKEIINVAAAYKPMPILDELGYKINKHISVLESGLSSGDEASILTFLRQDVEPLFDHLSKYSKAVKRSVDDYRSALDSELGFLYKKRKDFEDSVLMINETISAYIDSEEELSQKMFPHYFEKYKTDGVEHSMYIGESLVSNGNYNPVYLKNLRLWQIMILCGAERRVKQLQKDLKVPLETAHLILVQNSPLSIKFHFDEKKFDVDGTYNIRYEVMKKRIDKAEIRGKEERLTQPGKIAIVYSNESEAAEYREYIEFLQVKGYLEKELEQFDLEDLQGVHGLKALRVTVSNRPIQNDEKINPEEVKRVVESMSHKQTTNLEIGSIN